MAPDIKSSSGLPQPLIWGAVGYVLGGVLGGIVGFVVGMHTHVATAGIATFELGIPSALIGGLIGLICGSVFVGVRRLVTS